MPVSDILEPDPAILAALPEALVRRHKVVPVKKEGNKLTVAMSGALNLVAMDDLRLITGNEIVPVIVPEEEIKRAIQKFYGVSNLEKELQDFEVVEDETLQIDQPGEDLFDEAPVVRLVNSIIVGAIEDRASDIHIEPRENGVRVRYRIDGILREVMNNVPHRARLAIISRIKILADLNIAEKRNPQDGRIKIRYYNRDIDLRVSTMPTVFGEKVVIRILDNKNTILKLDQLGLEDGNLKLFKKIINGSYGMVLLTGPTGSGKTTTLYAALNELNDPGKNILTIEDPVEYILEGVNQTQVNVQAGLTFAAGLRSIVRQDPDIIMVGEIRDPETADIAIRAATTGHLVLSTMHTSDSSGALLRLLDMGIENYRVASSVLGVVAQRLVRKICPRCRQSYYVYPGEPEFAYIGKQGQKVKLYAGRGCRHCNYTGYYGRVSIQEVLVVTEKIRRCLIEKAPASEIRRAAVSEGMALLKEDGLYKALQGITTIEEVMRVSL